MAISRRARHEQGFSLIEALVAMAIIAGMVGLFAQTLAQDARVEQAARRRAVAVALARSVLDRAAAGEPVSAGTSAGLRWQLVRRPYGLPDPLARAPLEEFVVLVAEGTGVAPGGAPLVTLITIRVRA